MNKYVCVECDKEIKGDIYECSVCSDVYCADHEDDHECEDEDEEDE